MVTISSRVHRIPASEAVGLDDNDYQVLDTDTETTVSTVTATPGPTSRAWVCYGVLGLHAGDRGTYTARLKFDSTTLETRASLTGNIHVVAGFQSGPSAEAHTLTLTVERTIDEGAFALQSAVGFREVSALAP